MCTGIPVYLKTVRNQALQFSSVFMKNLPWVFWGTIPVNRPSGTECSVKTVGEGTFHGSNMYTIFLNIATNLTPLQGMLGSQLPLFPWNANLTRVFVVGDRFHQS